MRRPRRLLTGLVAAGVVAATGVGWAGPAGASPGGRSPSTVDGVPAALVRPAATLPTVEFFDAFAGGLATTGPGAKWSVPRDTATITASAGHFTAASSGVNPVTGEPAFTSTVPQDAGQTGIADHGKWVAQALPAGPTGPATFPATPTTRTTCATSMSVRTYGTAAQPFGAAVTDPESDPRLATVALTVNVVPDNVLFDLTVTDREIWARYESVQLPAGGAAPASFAYAVPVAARTPGRSNLLAVSYDGPSNSFVFGVDGRDVLTVPRPGTYSLGRQFLAVDHGGVPRVVRPAALSCGVGMFTLLDDRLATGPDLGLVRLAGAPGFYLDPLLGAPHEQRFVDDRSLPGSRLFGQGAGFDMHLFTVLSQQAG